MGIMNKFVLESREGVTGIREYKEKRVFFCVSLIFSYLCNENIKIRMNGSHIERIPQEGECRENGEGGILESASAFAHGVLEEIKALAGTTTCKSVQLARLKKWAQEQDCWYGNLSPRVSK